MKEQKAIAKAIKLIDDLQDETIEQELTSKELDWKLEMIKIELSMTEELSVICQYCKKEIGKKPCIPEMKDKVSHSICAQCAHLQGRVIND